MFLGNLQYTVLQKLTQDLQTFILTTRLLNLRDLMKQWLSKALTSEGGEMINAQMKHTIKS